MPKNFAQKHHFILEEFLRFQRTFCKKSFGRGLGQKPQLTTNTKNAAMPRFYFVKVCWNCVPNLPPLLFFRRKVSKRTLYRIHHFILAKLLKLQRTFCKKSFGLGPTAEAPNRQCLYTRFIPAVTKRRLLSYYENSTKPHIYNLFIQHMALSL